MSTTPESPVRSPSYPVMSLADAIAAVHKIEGQYRSSKVDRAIAAKMIGYSSLSGPANKALAALAQYGLVERAGKGEMRVTPRARAILHPDNDTEKRRELQAAALEPSLFREMQERWPEMIPPEEAVTSYFNRRGFNPSAIRPAARAYLQTLLYLEEENDSDSHGSEQVDAPSGPPNTSVPESLMQLPEPPVVAAAIPSMPARAQAAGAPPALNKINMNVQGGQVYLEAMLDRKGLAALKRKLTNLEALLDDEDEEVRPDEGGSENEA